MKKSWMYPGILAILVCLLTGRLLAQSTSTPPQDDTQVWHETQLIATLSKNTDFIFMGGLRLGRNVSHLTDERDGAGFAFKLNRYLTLQPTYWYIAQQPFAGRKSLSHRLILDATVKFPSVSGFTFLDRNRFERQIRHSRNDISLYRNRLTVEHPVRLGEVRFGMFVSDEAFYNITDAAWFRNRVTIGVKKDFHEKRFGTEFYYSRQNDGRSRPGDLHIIGTSFKIHL